MNRHIKLSKLLKLSAVGGSTSWNDVLAEAESETLPNYPEIAALGESVEQAKELKSKTEEVAGTVATFTQKDYDELRGLAQNSDAFDAMLVELQKTSSCHNAISKRAGLWDSMKSMFSVGLRIMPFIGVIASAYFMVQNWNAVEAAETTIKQNFKEFDGNGGNLFDPKHIAALITQHSNDPGKILALTKLNKVAKFYRVNVMEWWLNAVMGVCDIINSVVVLATWGGAAAIEALLIPIAAAAGYVGLATVGGMISVSFFDGLVGDFIANSTTVKSIAGRHIAQPTQDESETIEEPYDI